MKRHLILKPLVGIAMLLAAAPACSKKHVEEQEQEQPEETAGPTGAAGPTAAERSEADQIFATRCTPCHGNQGKGDGPASATLNPKPRNFTDGAWQKVVPDGEIEKAIEFGGAAVGKSPAMPPNPDLVARPGVVAGLRLHVRGLTAAH